MISRSPFTSRGPLATCPPLLVSTVGAWPKDLFTELHVITMYFLNYILVSFSLRIGSQREELFFKASLKEACTLFLALPPPDFLPSKSLAQIKFLGQGGMFA
jgi:hypothetical protein